MRCGAVQRQVGADADAGHARRGEFHKVEQFGPRRLLDLAVAAENAGFDSVWTSDHFQPWKHTDGHAPNSLV